MTDEEGARLALQERSNGVVSWASYFVVDELIARSADPNPREAGKGRAALRRLSQHATMYDGSVQRVNFVADPREQLAEVLFGASRRKEQRVVDIYGTVVQTIANEADPTKWPTWVTEFTKNMRDHIGTAEAHFVETVWTSLVLELVPDAQSWADVRKDKSRANALAYGIASQEGYQLCAELFAGAIAEAAKLTPDDQQLAAAAATMMKDFPLGMRVFNTLHERVAGSALDVSRPEVRNTLWDMQLALSIPASSEVSRTPVWLITGDGMIRAAAQKANASHLVHRREDYLSLTADGYALRNEIAKFENLRP